MDEQNNQGQTDGLTNIQSETTMVGNKKSKKNLIIISSSILTSLLVFFLIIQFINLGGFSGIKIRKTWNKIESFLNQYTNDDFKITSQNGDMLKISFDENGLLDFSCWEPSVFNMGYSGLRCSFKYYYNNQTTDRLGRYYLLKNLRKVDELIENTQNIIIVDKRFNDYRRISFNSEKELKQFFDKLIEIKDFNNTWEIYKKLIITNGKIQETQLVNEDNPINIIDPNAIYLDNKIHNYFNHVLSDYESLFDYAYEHNW